MKRSLKMVLFFALGFVTAGRGFAQSPPPSAEIVHARLEKEYSDLFELYQHLHTHPELSFEEEKTSARVAEELRKAGYEVATGVGKRGVVGVLRNSNG